MSTRKRSLKNIHGLLIGDMTPMNFRKLESLRFTLLASCFPRSGVLYSLNRNAHMRQDKVLSSREKFLRRRLSYRVW